MVKHEMALLIADKRTEHEGQILAKKLHLPVIYNADEAHNVLVITNTHLELRCLDESMQPIVIDFLAKDKQYRLAKSRGRSELIARAVGIKGRYYPKVVDATAGLGGDALILAHLGCKVTMIERSAILGALLEDALQRFRAANIPWSDRLALECLDAKILFRQWLEKKIYPEVVYLDPMFPERKKSALVKKEMRVLKRLVGEDLDAAELFTLAKQLATKRVVVKRPRYATTITDEAPTIVFNGKSCRFDVYLIPAKCELVNLPQPKL